MLDGPYAESKEQLGGYYLIDVPDLDAALSWAARCPAASHGVGRGASDLGDVGRERDAAKATSRRAARRRRWRAAATASSSPSSPRARATSRRPRTRSPRRSPRRWPTGRERLPGQSRGLAADGGAAQADRRARGGDRPAKARRADLRLLAEELAARRRAREIPDQRLALMFACAHPAIEAGIRAPLMLQAVLGLDAAAIASAFLVSPAAMGKRLVRAKDEDPRRPAFRSRVPERDELPRRLDAVLDAIYAAFAEGWSRSGRHRCRPPRSRPEEAICSWRGWSSTLLPDGAGGARPARADAARRGAPPARAATPAATTCRWRSRTRRSGTRRMIDEAEALLRRAERARRDRPLPARGGAAVGARRSLPHRRRQLGGRRAALRRAVALTGSPVVAINRALAVAETATAPRPALAALDAVAGDARLAEYQPYWAARAELLAHDRRARARRATAYDIAIGLERDPAVRRFLQRRAASAGPAQEGYARGPIMV